MSGITAYKEIARTLNIPLTELIVGRPAIRNIVSQSILLLSETLIRGLLPDQATGGLAGRFGYGPTYENDVFFMNTVNGDPDNTETHFCHKRSKITIRWHKRIGHGITVFEKGKQVRRSSISKARWIRIFNECYESIPEAARLKARAECETEALKFETVIKENNLTHLVKQNS